MKSGGHGALTSPFRVYCWFQTQSNEQWPTNETPITAEQTTNCLNSGLQKSTAM